MKLIPIFILFFLTNNAYANLFGPSNYEECVADGKTGRTNSELGFHMDKCLIKFPKVPSIFKGTDKYVLCRFSNDRRFGFDIKANKKTNLAKVNNNDLISDGKVTSFGRDNVEFIFVKNNVKKEVVLIEIDNAGNFSYRDEKGVYSGTCVEVN